MSNGLALWQPDSGQLIPAEARTSRQIANYAAQLSVRDRNQIVAAFEAGHFEMGMNYLWGKTVTALKKELSTVGIGLLGEMLGRADVDEDDDIDDILTTRDAIRLAGELGVVSTTDALRLQHTYEIVTHFAQLDAGAGDTEDIDESEAIASLKACIKSVLGRPKVEIAKKFVDFRSALEGESLSADDPRVEMLRGSPYFFCKLTTSVLMNGAKRNIGAQLEHALANINVILPAIWETLRDAERWQIGQTYAETYANGKSIAVSGLKSALLKVHGFDYVPENLRSETFLRAAEAVIKAHEEFNNFYNEAAPVSNLAKLGSTIPTPALPACATAILCVLLGNRYGVARTAQSDASKIVSNFTPDRWQYYLNQVLPSDIRILSKLSDDGPVKRWLTLVGQHDLANISVKNKSVAKLLRGAKELQPLKVKEAAQTLIRDFYGKTA
ncbi:hypothetical protein [Burkholderia ubonensis]|uniref:hypothetical protein n=1 Tax=Burkholderia ubonensis TaxID=101571 RepID=UPI000A6150ED|nr:hypothetical protein [Burkholderia ubonensis]